MQYIIKDTANGYDYYFQKNHHNVIVFDSEQEAGKFINDFYQFSGMQAQGMAFFGDDTIFEDIRRHQSMTEIVELPENFNRDKIYFRDMR